MAFPTETLEPDLNPVFIWDVAFKDQICMTDLDRLLHKLVYRYSADTDTVALSLGASSTLEDS
jgi:hypothetical protein